MKLAIIEVVRGRLASFLTWNGSIFLVNYSQKFLPTCSDEPKNDELFHRDIPWSRYWYARKGDDTSFGWKRPGTSFLSFKLTMSRFLTSLLPNTKGMLKSQ